MSRQCRICLDTENPNSMVSPCNCRGTSAYIHSKCLNEYLHHYPDGLCRVCRKNMIVVYPYEIILFAMLMILLLYTNIPTHTKFIYVLMTLPIFLTNRIHKIFTLSSVIGLVCLSSLFLVIQPEYSIPMILGITIVGVLATIAHYIPPQFILMLASIGLGGLYIGILTIYIATTTDSYMLSYFSTFVSMLWLLFVNLRPPFHAIN